MRFSIVIPNYNSGEVLERAIVSLLRQNYSGLQLILADSESTDISREVIERYRPAFDRLIIRKDQGQADGLNHGFEAADGDIFGWLCADDELLPGTLDHVAEIFTKSPDADVVLGACERIYADGSPFVALPEPNARQLIGSKCVIEQSSTFWRAGLHRRAGPLDTSFHLAFDWNMWCRMKDSGARFVTTNQVLSRYHFSADNKSGSSGRKHVDEGFRIVQLYGPWGLARLYRFLYMHFDLHGCYDNPPTCTRMRGALFTLTMKTLQAIVGQRLLYMYNWHFASLQERGLKWW